MNNKTLLMIGSGACLLFALFSGCGGNPGEKEYKKAMASWKENDLVRAQSQLEKAIRKMSGNEHKSSANNQLGIICWNLGKVDLAIESFGESCRLADKLTGANLNLGMALYHAGQLDQARFELTTILNEEPDNAMARLYLGFVLLKQQKWQEAYQELSAGLRDSPNNAAGQNALALAELHTSRNSDVAVKRLKQLLAAYPDYTPAIYNLAMIHDKWLNNPTAALGWYKQYLQKAGEDGMHMEAASQAVTRLGKAVQQASNREPEKKPDPVDATQYIATGTQLHAAKKYQEAISQYEKAIQTDPMRVDAHYNLGLSHYELKQYHETIQACTEVLRINPDYANARYMLALSYARLEDWDNAEREAKALDKLDAERSKSLMKFISDSRK